eukprot:161560_1
MVLLLCRHIIAAPYTTSSSMNFTTTGLSLSTTMIHTTIVNTDNEWDKDPFEGKQNTSKIGTIIVVGMGVLFIISIIAFGFYFYKQQMLMILAKAKHTSTQIEMADIGDDDEELAVHLKHKSVRSESKP